MKHLKHQLLILCFLCSGKLFVSFAQKSDSVLIQHYFIQFQEYEYTNANLALRYVDSALTLAKESNHANWIGRAYQFKGWYFQDNALFKQANDCFYQSLAAFKKSGDRQGVADAYGNLGNSYLDLHEYQKSLNYQLLSLEENKKILRTKSLSTEQTAAAETGRTYALHNIGTIYSEIKMFDKALEYEFKSLVYERKSKNHEGLAISYNTLANIHKELNHVDSAIYYFRKSIDLYESEKVDYPFGYASALQSFASMPNSGLSKKQQDAYWHKSLLLRREFGDVDGEARTLLEIAENRFTEIKTDSLSRLLKHVYEIITTHELDMLLENYLKLYSKYNSRIGKYDSAYFALENYLELKEVSDEKRRTHDLIAGDIKHQLKTKHFNDSLRIEHSFAVERATHHEEISRIQNVVYLSLIGLITLIVSLFFIVSSNRRRRRMNEILSEKNSLINKQKDEVEHKNKAISDSINYAKRLQLATLPTKEEVNLHLPDSFLLYLPKDIVSGDFHWFEHKNGISFLAVADCTGHGVPGAMVSVVCSNALNRSVNEFGIREPSKILDKTRELVIENFAQGGDQVQDGMDISLIAVDHSSRKLHFSGANNGLWLIRNSQKPVVPNAVSILEIEQTVLYELKGDKQPVGAHTQPLPFTEKQLTYEPGDMIYLQSDGFADQFGGPDGKKYKYQQLKRFLATIHELPTNEQLDRLSIEFKLWKGSNDQVDDVCLVGIRMT